MNYSTNSSRPSPPGAATCLMGQLAAIGIVKGQPFEPDERMHRILGDAAAVEAAASRALMFNPRDSDRFAVYDDSAWTDLLFVGGYDFETPPPLVTSEGIMPLTSTGARPLQSRTAFFYGCTGITPAMCMRLAGLGSQYLIAAKDADGIHVEGGRSYQVVLPAGIPAARFRSLTAMTPRRAPCGKPRSASPGPAASPSRPRQRWRTRTARQRSRSHPSDRRTSRRPTGSRRRPGRGWFTIPRLYSPLQPLFDRSWRPSEIEAMD